MNPLETFVRGMRVLLLAMPLILLAALLAAGGIFVATQAYRDEEARRIGEVVVDQIKRTGPHIHDLGLGGQAGGRRDMNAPWNDRLWNPMRPCLLGYADSDKDVERVRTIMKDTLVQLQFEEYRIRFGIRTSLVKK